MKNLLLGIVAINLTFISINLTLRSVEQVHSQEDQNGESIFCDPSFDRFFPNQTEEQKQRCKEINESKGIYSEETSDDQTDNSKKTNNSDLTNMVDDAILVNLIKNTVARNCYSEHDHDSISHDHDRITITTGPSRGRYTVPVSREMVLINSEKARISCS